MSKVKKLNKKILAIVFLIIIILGAIHPIFAATVITSGTAKWVAGQYDSDIYTTDSQGNVGMIIRRLTNYTTGEKVTMFCAEYGVDISTGSVQTGTHSVPTDASIKKACKVAYFGWYSRYGDYAVDGGILAADMKWVKEHYVFTQQMIWQTLNQTTATFRDAEVENRYLAFKSEIEQKMANMELQPSFTNSTITLDVGTTTTLTDSYGVLSSYASIDRTVHGIRIQHNHGENTMNVTISEDCSIESYIFTIQEMESYGLIKEETRNHDTTVYITFKAGVQNQLYAMNYNDPVSMPLSLQINSFGRLELSKLNTDGDLVNGAIFQVNGPDGYSKEVTVTNGKITVDNLKRGTYTIKEKSAPHGYLINTNTYTVQVVPNQTTTQAIVNEKPTGTFTLVKKSADGTKLLEGTKYRIWNDKGYDKEFSTDKNGNITVAGLELGTYRYKEIQATNGYLLDTNVYSFELKYKDQNTSVVYANAERTNKEPTGTFTLVKKNEDGTKVIEGTKYRIWNNNGYDKEFTTDAQGKITVTGLKMGNYNYKEIQASYGYLLDTNTYSFELKYKDQNTSVIYANAERTNKEPTGTFTLVKKNANKTATIEGTKYRIWSDNGYDKEFTTNNEGKIVVEGLKMGNYNYKEIQASNGYLLDGNTYTFELKYKDQNTSIIYANAERTNEEPTGTISIIKRDSETGGTPQGDATLENAKYEVFANEDIYNKAKTKKFYSKGDLVATRTVNAEGITADVTELPLGKYMVKESVASKGYLIDKAEYQVNLLYKDQNTKVITEGVTSLEVVKKMQVHIFKSGIKENSGLVSGLEGAEFTIKLNSDVENAYSKGYTYAEVWNGIDEYGNKVSVNKNRVQEAQKIAPTYEAITTDEDGNAYTQSNLPFGKYIVKETVTPKDFESAADFTFTITKDESEIVEVAQKVKHLVVNNEQLETYLKMIKKDLKTNKTVTLSSSTFQIKATKDVYDRGTGKIIYKTGDVIKQKVGNTTYSSFTTNSDNIVVPEGSYNSNNDNKGSVVTPLLLPVGSYEITEVRVPEGFLQLENPVTFKIEGLRDYDKDQDGDYIKEIIVKNEQPTGILIVDKYIATREEKDTSLIDRSDLSGIEFTLVAKENIIDMADGSIIYEKGKEVKKLNLNKEGSLQITNLPIGTYELYESRTIDGLVSNKTIYEVKFTQEDLVTKVYEKTIDVVNDTTAVEFSKQSVTGDGELIGAKLTVIDDNGEIIDAWISTVNTHIIEGLIVGKTYILREEIAPEGFVKATEIEFTIEDTAEIQKVNMIDKIVEMTKTDITGEEIEGAKIIVYDKDQNVIDEWTSTKEPHRIKNLVEGETYILHEEIAVEGFVKATDIEFTVTTNKDIQQVTMVDKIVEMSKVDFGGNEIEGAKIIVYDKEKNVIDEWISTNEPHKIRNLEEGKTYILHEEIAPKGFVKATDIEFTVGFEKENQKIVMADKIVEMSKENIAGEEVEGARLKVFDKDGNIVDEWESTKEPHKINNLIEGENYILHEEYAPEGYVVATDIEFTVGLEKESQKIVMVDKIVEMTKVNIAGEEVEGAKIRVFDKEGTVVDEWESTKEPHKIKNLVEGQTYILHEEYAPDGYTIATDIEFTVGLEKETQKLEMIDKVVEITKSDIAGAEIEGAELKVYDKDGEIVDEWTSGKESHRIKNLKEGETYILHEEYAPDGFTISTDIEFTVGLEKETQKIEMTDKIVEMSKIDVAGEEIEGATIVVTNKRTKNIVDKWVSEKVPHKIKGLIEGETYIIHEEIVAEGYVKATDIEFTVSEDKETQKIEMIDKVVLVSKTDLVTGEELPGAKLVVTDKDGNVVDEWISGNEPHYVSGLEEGKEYTLTEITSPYGYEVAESITFKVTEDKETQLIEMKDMPILTNIKLVKMDSDTGEIIKSKFKFAIYEDGECTKLIKEVESNIENGTVEFEDLGFGTFFIKEIEAPSGYYLSEEIVKLEINEDGVFINDEKIEEKDEAYSFNFYDILIPTIQTGNEVNNILLLSLMVFSLIGIAFGIAILIKKKY